MELKDKQWKFSRMISELLIFIHSQGCDIQFGDFWRSTDKLYVPSGESGFEDDAQYSYQELLFYNKKSKVTYGTHNDRCASDLILYRNGKALKEDEYRQFGEKWESIGGRWGGRFGVNKADYAIKLGWDVYHFELTV